MRLTRGNAHLFAGLVLFVYVLGHLINHAFGVVSLEVLNAARTYLISPWTSKFGIVVLASAALFHLGSALWVLYNRRSLKIAGWQWAQLIMGLLIPLLVADHAVGTGYARLIYDVEPNYDYVLAVMWHFDPAKGWLQMGLLLAAWGHACVGLHNWLKVYAAYRRWQLHLYALALLIPVMASMGFVSAGLDAKALAQDPRWLFEILNEINFPGNEAVAELFHARDTWMTAYVAMVIAVVGLRYVRITITARSDPLTITYAPTGEQVIVRAGATVLETLKEAGIEHASICGGRARCSTCRVRVIEMKPGDCNKMAAAEQGIINQLRVPSNVRLSCQLVPKKSIVVEPLLPPDVSMSEAFEDGLYTTGHEVDLTVMFADLRGFTSLSEDKLPFDVVYLLNRYFESMGKAIEDAGGELDKFIGDGIMATFPGQGTDDHGARAALRAAIDMCDELKRMNETLRQELKEPLRLGIGIHAGGVIRGTMGFGAARQVTVIGDTVNTAARLEAETKVHGVQLLFSETVGERAGIALEGIPTIVTQVRGKQEELTVYMVEDACGDLSLELPQT